MALPAILGGILKAAPLVGKLAGVLTGNRANARAQESTLNQRQDATNLDMAQAAAQNARANVATDSGYRSQAMNDALRMALLGGVQDVSITPPEGVTMGQISGGLRPSAIQNKGALASKFGADAMKRYDTGAPGLVTSMPTATQPSKANWIDKIGNVASFLGGAADVYHTFKGGDGGGDGGNLALNEGYSPEVPPIRFGANPFVRSDPKNAAMGDMPTKLTAPIRQRRVSFIGG